MAKILLSLLGILLVLNAAIFLLVAVQDTGTETDPSQGNSARDIQDLKREMKGLSKKMAADLAKVTTPLRQVSRKLDSVARDVKSLSGKVDRINQADLSRPVATRSPTDRPGRRVPVLEEEETEAEEPEVDEPEAEEPEEEDEIPADEEPGSEDGDVEEN